MMLSLRNPVVATMTYWHSDTKTPWNTIWYINTSVTNTQICKKKSIVLFDMLTVSDRTNRKH